MLTELQTVGEWYQNDDSAQAWDFEEIQFDQKVRDSLTELYPDIKFYSSTVKISISSKICYVPFQYFLFALRIRPLAELLREYLNVFEELKDGKRAEDVKNSFDTQTATGANFDKLDHISKERFYKVFAEKGARFDAKSIFNEPKKKTIIRSTSDFFGSIVLKALPVRDDSSGILGQIVNDLSANLKVYDSLEEEFAWAISYLVANEDADNFLLQLFTILTIKDDLKSIWDDIDIIAQIDAGDESLTVNGIDNFFLIKDTAVVGNKEYFDDPVTYRSDLGKFIHLKKGVLSAATSIEAINTLLSDYYPNLQVRRERSQYILCSTSRISETARIKGAQNKIYYGAPGTGKSYKINEDTAGHTVFRTVFHPDTQYVDFVGGLKPHMGDTGIEYAFRPGPFISAYITAINNPSERVCLIVEELNRAPAAAVFGEIFQLLDRNENGSSIYSIDISDPDMQEYVDSSMRGQGSAGKLSLPSNFSILASMNSSDQAVMPMDTAFKRRWYFEYLPIDFRLAARGTFELHLTGGKTVSVEWPVFAGIINNQLTSINIPEDRLLGHRFLSDQELAPSNARQAMKGKLLMYLWDDVLRHGKRQQIFRAEINGETIGSFGQLINKFDAKECIFAEAIEEKLIASTDAAAPHALD